MIPLDYYVVSWQLDKNASGFHAETVADMLKRNRGIFATQYPTNYIALSFEKSQDAANAAIEEFQNILKLAKEERMALLQDWPTEPIDRPSCPKCNTAMVWRTSKTGVNAGKQFWGCLSFPGCKGTRNG